jgi:hypothetical protein
VHSTLVIMSAASRGKQQPAGLQDIWLLCEPLLTPMHGLLPRPRCCNLLTTTG